MCFVLTTTFCELFAGKLEQQTKIMARKSFNIQLLHIFHIYFHTICSNVLGNALGNQWLVPNSSMHNVSKAPRFKQQLHHNPHVLRFQDQLPHKVHIGIILELRAKVREDFTITEKACTRTFSWLKVPTSAFTFKTLLRHYAKRALTPR